MSYRKSFWLLFAPSIELDCRALHIHLGNCRFYFWLLERFILLYSASIAVVRYTITFDSLSLLSAPNIVFGFLGLFFFCCSDCETPPGLISNTCTAIDAFSVLISFTAT